MKKLMNPLSILSMLGALVLCLVVAGLGLYLFTDRGARAVRSGSSRGGSVTNPLTV